MAEHLPNLIELLRQRVPEARGELRPEWGSNHPQTRAAIRASITAELNYLTDKDRQKLADLSQPPRVSAWSVSISHAPNLGGWLAVPRPHRVGLDVEKYDRLKANLIRRTSSSEEMQAAPDPLLLWSAKESLYKSLEDAQPPAFSQILIDTWQTATDGFFLFEGGFNHHRARGLVIHSDSFCQAFSLTVSD